MLLRLPASSSAGLRLSELLLVGSASSPPLLLPPCASFRLVAAVAIPPMASPEISVEYAKSNRSSCKACGKSIPKGSLRRGLSSKDPRGFDMTKWYHLDCFPVNTRASGVTEEVLGCSLLEVVAGEAETEDVERMTKKPKFGDRNEVEVTTFSISDMKTTYKDAILPPKWKAFKTVIFREADDGLRDSDKIAAFDFDGCLVNTSPSRIGPNAWSLQYPSIPEKLQNLYNDDYKLVIFTNESNIERWKNKRQVAIDSKIGRIENFLKRVEVPIQVFIACGLGKGKDQPDDPFRKPNTGMWIILEKYFNSGIEIDMERSFYVGDAAGRKNDHSNADAKFAEAVGLKFHLPEPFFGSMMPVRDFAYFGTVGPASTADILFEGDDMCALLAMVAPDTASIPTMQHLIL